MVGLDWLSERRSKARARMMRLNDLLKTADSLRKAKGASFYDCNSELWQTLCEVDSILKLYPGTRTVALREDLSLREEFCLDQRRLQSDDEYYQEVRVMNFALELLRYDSIQRLRPCRECRNWYYAMTDGQLFCKPNCRQRSASHSKTFRERRREYMRDYRRHESERNKRAESLARRTK